MFRKDRGASIFRVEQCNKIRRTVMRVKRQRSRWENTVWRKIHLAQV